MRQPARPFMLWLLLGSALLVSMVWADDGWQAAYQATPGVIQMRCMAVPDEGPPAHPNDVRVTHIRGSWTLEPTARGGSEVTYVVASHPGGAMPTWLINAAQKEAVPNLLKAMLQHVEKNATK